jgi:hypothetical protein
MTIILLLGAVLLLFSIWVFVKLRPPLRFTIWSLLTAGLLCVLFSIWIISRMNQGDDSSWGPVLALCGSSIIFPVVLLCFILIKFAIELYGKYRSR